MTAAILFVQSPELYFNRAVVTDAVLADQARVQAIARPDPWTGSDGRETRRQVVALRDDVESLKYRQAADDVHRREAAGGYSRIRDCEREIAVLRAQVQDLRQDQHDHEALH